ncbi:MAG: hypothetical protein Q9157_003316 [Trypethelium eluteriae]
MAGYPDNYVRDQNQLLGPLNEGKGRKVEATVMSEDLLHRALHLRQRYGNRKAERILQRLLPFFTSLQSFSEVVKVFLQASPAIVTLLWGSLASRYAKGLEHIFEIFDSIDCNLPRFCFYYKKFNGNNVDRLKEALQQYREEIHGIFNIFYTSFGRLRNRIDKRLAKLQSLTALVDEEARVASDELQEGLQRSHHQELLQRLPSKDTFMLLRREPFENLPTVKNSSFHGRTAELQRLEQRLRPGTSPEKLLIACLCGLGGIGKTQIALEFAYRFIEDYDAILWISAENSLKLGDSFSGIAHDLGLADNSIQNPNQLRELVRRWLVKDRKKGTRPGQSSRVSLLIWRQNPQNMLQNG